MWPKQCLLCCRPDAENWCHFTVLRLLWYLYVYIVKDGEMHCQMQTRSRYQVP